MVIAQDEDLLRQNPQYNQQLVEKSIWIILLHSLSVGIAIPDNKGYKKNFL